MNILTFDIEEWGLAKIGGYGSSEKYAEYDTYLNQILNKLDEDGCKGTFFCTGPMAEYFPPIVKLIASRGHEIGCHSYYHTWMNKLSMSVAKEDTHKSVDLLEQCLGEKIYSYRAPAFSIGESNLWMLEILAENGITRDSSIFPTTRDLGGFPNFESQCPCLIQYNGVKLEEYPIPMATLCGRKIAYSGGGYFRLFPLEYVKREINKTNYAMTYFHIGDLVPERSKALSKEAYESYFKEKGTIFNRYKRHLKTNIGKKGAMNKLMRLVDSVPFDNIEKASSIIQWNQAPMINLGLH